MEKVIYTLRGDGGDAEAFGGRLRGDVADGLAAAGAHGVVVEVVDGDVAPAAGLRIASSPAPPDAIVSVWVDSASDALRAPVDAVIERSATVIAAFLVTESVPLAGVSRPEVRRAPGFTQVAFLRRPAGLAVTDWLERWLDDHTPRAIGLQDTSVYVQNVVTRVLRPGPVEWHAIVEESFPEAAMTDPHVFFDAVGDDERLATHQREMLASVQRFVDLAMIDVIPTSRYVFGSPTVP